MARFARTAIALTACLAACSAPSPRPPESSTVGVGPNPQLPVPNHSLIPTVDIAPAVGWSGNEAPVPAPGLTVRKFADGLDHPRWLYVLPNGDVLVAESNAPGEKGKSGVGGIKGAVMGKVMKQAGAGVNSPDKLVLLRDANGDGVPELKQDFLTNLRSPFGMALVGNTLYVANADAVVSVPYATGQSSIGTVPQKVIDLPGKGNEINHHWTKSLLASRDGKTLYIGVGSNSNILENGVEAETNRADILELDLATKQVDVYATGLRNPVGLAWEPTTGALWTVVNERDELGNDLVPDYLTSLKRGAFYGWPYSYWGQHVDVRAKPPRPDLVAKAILPGYGLGSHVAPLGLAFQPAAAWTGGKPGALVGMHGSWNRSPRAGYKVVFIPFANGMAVGPMMDVLNGFVDSTGHAHGRPVGVVLDRHGGILVADDVGNAVWRLTPSR